MWVVWEVESAHCAVGSAVAVLTLCGAGGVSASHIRRAGFVCVGLACFFLAVLLALAIHCWRVLNPPFTEGGFIPLFPFYCCR